MLEKRLGILQLCLLLAVLVFMTLTRGSRGEHASAHRAQEANRPTGMREWGRRTLSFSGDWVARFRSRSPSPKSVTRPDHKPPEAHNGVSPASSLRASTYLTQRKWNSPLAALPHRRPLIAPSSAPSRTHPPLSPASLRATSPCVHARRPRCGSPRPAYTMCMRAARVPHHPPRACR